MKGYENYRESGVSWLGRIPAHWGIARGKNLYRKMNRPVNNTDEVITCFRDGQVTLRKNRRTTGFTESLKEIGYQGIKKGDLVIHVMDAFAGAIGVSDSDGKGTPVYNVCQAKGESNNTYYAYVLREMARTGYIQSLYRGIRERSSDFRFEIFARQYYPVPPIDEQEQIARFLDWKISGIDRMISIRQKQITGFAELKKALITQTVMRGNWERVKLRHILRSVSVKNHPELPLLSVTREKGVIIRDVEDFEANRNFIPDDLSGYKVVRSGQLVINKMKAWQGSCGISDYTGIVSPAYFVFDVKFDNLRFFHYAIRSSVYVNFFAQASDGIRVGQWDLQMDKIKDIPFPVPPITEQIRIAKYLDKKCSLIDRAISNLTQQINTLKELKASLISEAVTGKIDVRHITIPVQEKIS